MKLKNCQKCGTSTDLSKMTIQILENPEPYMVDGFVFEKIIELLCKNCVNSVKKEEKEGNKFDNPVKNRKR